MDSVIAAVCRNRKSKIQNLLGRIGVWFGVAAFAGEADDCSLCFVELAADFGELLDQRNAAEELTFFDGGSTEIALARWDIRHDSALGAEHRAVANVQVIGEADLAG